MSLFGPPLTLFQLREFTLEDGAESKDGGLFHFSMKESSVLTLRAAHSNKDFLIYPYSFMRRLFFSLFGYVDFSEIC